MLSLNISKLTDIFFNSFYCKIRNELVVIFQNKELVICYFFVHHFKNKYFSICFSFLESIYNLKVRKLWNNIIDEKMKIKCKLNFGCNSYLKFFRNDIMTAVF